MNIHKNMIVTAENAKSILDEIEAQGAHKTEIQGEGKRWTFTIDGRNGGYICETEAAAIRSAVRVLIGRVQDADGKPISIEEHLDRVEAAINAREAKKAETIAKKKRKAELKAELESM